MPNLYAFFQRSLASLALLIFAILPVLGQDVVRINCGGQAVNVAGTLFEADTYFTGQYAKAYSNFRIEDIGNTDRDELFLTEMSSRKDGKPFGYRIPVESGTYEVILHFAEIYWGATGGGPGGSGRRVFSVRVEGTPAVVDLDLNAEVGPMKALTRSVTTTVDDGVLSLWLTASVNRPKLSAIEVLGSSDPMPEDPQPEDPQPEEPTTPAEAIRINCGGKAATLDGLAFEADRGFYGQYGTTYANNKISDIKNTTLDALYWTERSTRKNRKPFGYEIDVPNGVYELRLHFAEIYWGATGGGPGGDGQRVFSVSVEGDPLIVDLDLHAEVGPETALVKTFDVEVADGALSLWCTASVNRPKLSAIEIIGAVDDIPPTDPEPTDPEPTDPEPTDPEPLDPEACPAWTEVARSSERRLEAQSAKVGDKLYVFAGFLKDLKITGTTEIYHPESDTWSLGAPMPLALTHMGVVVIGEEVWHIGGFVGSHPGWSTSVVQIYNTSTDTWREGPELPLPRASGAAAFHAGKIHYFGGLLPDRQTVVNDHLVYDINNPELGWQEASPLPYARNHHSGAVIDGKIYAIGGQTGHDGPVEDMPYVHRYDPDTDTWTRVADLPRDRSHFEPGTVVHDKAIIIVGGRDGSHFFNKVTRYIPDLDQWEELCPLEETLLAPVAKVFGNRLYVTNGGRFGTSRPLNIARWITVPPVPEDSSNSSDILVPREEQSPRPVAVPSDIGPFLRVMVYPNPAGDLSRISFELTEPSRVELQVTDLQGRRVFVAPEQALPAGRQEMMLDLSHVQAGTLFYRLRVEDMIVSGRILKVR